MKFRYRIQNKSGVILSHVDTMQQAANVITGLGVELCRTHTAVDLAQPCAYPYTTFKPNANGFGFVGTQHSSYDNALKELL